jgi:hypothetical protein
MAIQTKSFCRISTHGVVRFEVFTEYHDDDFRVINDDGDPDDFRVIRWFGENYGPNDVSIQIIRGNGRHWQDIAIPADSTFTQNAGGPVRYEFDVPEWRYS